MAPMVNSVKPKRRHTIENELSKALVRFSYDRVSVKQAKELAAKMAPVFEQEAAKNEIVAHKGVTWFAKEILRVI